MSNIDFDIDSMKTRDISGFGGGYEALCQKMLKNGLKFLKQKESFDWQGYGQTKNVFGICIAETKDAKMLDKAIMKGIEDATGAMHHAVVNNLHYIWRFGLKKWLRPEKKDK